jgi:predicted pyridoxine 5'-phosphate oxidase superfamily flavin-nucleotide-binding protein
VVYHAGEHEVQARTGEFDDAVRVASVIRTFVPPPLARFLATQPWVMVGAADPAGQVWATVLYGPAGFIQAADETTIGIEALPPRGDPLEQLSSPVPAGLLAIDFARRMRARINGMLRRRETGFTLDVEQAYPNCMKYIQRREFAQGDPGPAGSDGLPGPITIVDHLSAQDSALVGAADTMFIATTAPAGSDVSHRGGQPGFIEITGPGTVRFADYPGNSMFNTLGNLHLDQRAGLLIPDFGTGDLLHLTGSASVDFDPPPDHRHPGARRIITVAASRVVRRAAALPFRYGKVEYSPFLPRRPGTS